jgi:hypothetical protein
VAAELPEQYQLSIRDPRPDRVICAQQGRGDPSGLLPEQAAVPPHGDEDGIRLAQSALEVGLVLAQSRDAIEVGAGKDVRWSQAGMFPGCPRSVATACLPQRAQAPSGVVAQRQAGQLSGMMDSVSRTQ